MFKRIIAFLLVLVTFILCFSSTALAFHSVDGDFVSTSGFWDWVVTNTDVIWSIFGLGNPLDGTENSCDVSDDHLHHASSAYPLKASLLNPGNMEFKCDCKYCGAPFSVDIPYDEAIELLKKGYGSPAGHGLGGTSGGTTGGFGPPDTGDTEATGFVGRVNDELGTTIVGLTGLQIPLPIGSYRLDYGSFSGPVNLGDNVSFTFLASRTVSSLCFLYYAPIMDSAPLEGVYTLRASYTCTPVNSINIQGLDEPITSAKGSSYPFVWINKKDRCVRFDVDANSSFTFSGRFWLEVQPISYNISDYTSSFGGISSRATSFTGDLGILGDNGQLTKVEGDQIFNETTNNYYNPSTGTTSTVTDWFYDYSDRSYHLTMESGDTVTVTYGDENITIQEGDTTYNVYYIIEGSASSDPCPEGGAHDWQAGETVDATCTVAGFKTEICSKCGEERTSELPALGHKWKVKQSVQTKYDDAGQLVQEGYTIYECERCGEQYKSTDSSGPPGGLTPGSGSGSGTGTDSGEDDESIWSKLGKFLGTLGDDLIDFVLALIGKVLDWLISLAEFIGDKLVVVAKVILDIFDFLPGLFTGFLTFLESAFGFLPTEIVMILTFGIAAIVFIGIIKAIRR